MGSTTSQENSPAQSGAESSVSQEVPQAPLLDIVTSDKKQDDLVIVDKKKSVEELKSDLYNELKEKIKNLSLRQVNTQSSPRSNNVPPQNEQISSEFSEEQFENINPEKPCDICNVIESNEKIEFNLKKIVICENESPENNGRDEFSENKDLINKKDNTIILVDIVQNNVSEVKNNEPVHNNQPEQNNEQNNEPEQNNQPEVIKNEPEQNNKPEQNNQSEQNNQPEGQNNEPDQDNKLAEQDNGLEQNNESKNGVDQKELYTVLRKYTDNLDDIEILRNYVNAVVEGKSLNYAICLYGLRGNGKTSFIRWLVKKMNENDKLTDILYVNTLDYSERSLECIEGISYLTSLSLACGHIKEDVSYKQSEIISTVLNRKPINILEFTDEDPLLKIINCNIIFETDDPSYLCSFKGSYIKCIEFSKTMN